MRAGVLRLCALLSAPLLLVLGDCAHRNAREHGPGADPFFTEPPPPGVLTPAPVGPGDRPPPRRAMPPRESEPPNPARNDSIVVTVDSTGEAPKSGDYVYIEELPEAITRVPPKYPEAARAARAQGTVMVQAFVRKDGSVGDVRVVKSIAGLDEAAMECVRQWKFKPALGGGKPVEVWVGVPVKFDAP